MDDKENKLICLAQNQVIETERLRLRPVTLKDTADMFEYASDEETVAFVFPRQETIEDTRKSIVLYFMEAPLGKYGIELKDTRKMIGTIDIRMSKNHPKGEIGYASNKAYWGNGYVPEAARALIKIGFEEAGLVRIEAYHTEENRKSGRVMEKIGMKREGLLRNHAEVKGKIMNSILYAITKEEYKS